MKKLSYLFALIGLFVFASCGNSANQATEATVEETVVEETVVEEAVVEDTTMQEAATEENHDHNHDH